MRSTHVFQPSSHSFAELERLRTTFISLYRRPRVVSGHVEHRQFTGELCLPIRPKLFTFWPTEHLLLPLHIVAVLERVGRQMRRSSLHLSRVQNAKLTGQDRQRPEIRNDVMDHK